MTSEFNPLHRANRQAPYPPDAGAHPDRLLYRRVIDGHRLLRTAEMMWANFSAWLLMVGVIIGVLAAIAGLVDFLSNRLIRAQAPAWPHLIGNLVVLVLAFFNVLIHTQRCLDLGGADGTRPLDHHRADPADHRLAGLGDGVSPWRGSGPMMSRARFLGSSSCCAARCSALPDATTAAAIRRPRSAPTQRCPSCSNICCRRCISPKSSAGRKARRRRCAQGLKIEPLATGLQHPRSLYTLPNGDVLVVESKAPPAAADQAAEGNRHGLHRVLGDVGRQYRAEQPHHAAARYQWRRHAR